TRGSAGRGHPEASLGARSVGLPFASLPGMTRALAIGAGVLGAVLSGSGMIRPAPNAPVATQAAVAVQFATLGTGLGSITSITSAGDSRVFLTIQSGTIRIWDGSQVLPAPFLDVSAKITCCGEQGLLSVVFHPQYARNG